MGCICSVSYNDYYYWETYKDKPQEKKKLGKREGKNMDGNKDFFSEWLVGDRNTGQDPTDVRR
jgi:hypothetical protein